MPFEEMSGIWLWGCRIHAVLFCLALFSRRSVSFSGAIEEEAVEQRSSDVEQGLRRAGGLSEKDVTLEGEGLPRQSSG